MKNNKTPFNKFAKLTILFAILYPALFVLAGIAVDSEFLWNIMFYPPLISSVWFLGDIITFVSLYGAIASAILAIIMGVIAVIQTEKSNEGGRLTSIIMTTVIIIVLLAQVAAGWGV